MALNKEDKTKLTQALNAFQGYESKQENNEAEGQRVEITFDTAFASQDEDLLRKLSEQVFSYLKEYPELMSELKEKYFKTL